DVVIETADDGLYDGMILRHLRGEIFLSLQQGSDVALEVNNFPGDSCDGAGPDEASADGANKNGCAENGDVAYTHDILLGVQGPACNTGLGSTLHSNYEGRKQARVCP